MDRIKSTIKPDVIQYLENQEYYFNYDIKKEEREIDDEHFPKETYSFVRIKLRGVPNYKDITRCLIRKFVTEDEEFELINEYNSNKLGITAKKSAEDNYLEYLNIVESIKQNVRNYFNKNIEK